MTSVYKVRFSNNASTTLAAGIASNSPSLQVLAGSGALFPVLANNEAFVCTLVKNGSPTIREIVLVTGRASGSDSFTGLVRNLSGTGALAWNAGDIVELRPTAEALSYFAQFTDLQAQQTNYATDVGSANAYKAVPSPPLNGRVVGMPISFLAAHANTGDSTFDDGLGSVPIRVAARPSGQSALLPNDIVAGWMHTVRWDGTYYELQKPRLYFDSLSGNVLNSQVPLSAILQWESSLAIAFSQLTGQLLQAQVPSGLNLPGSPTTTTQAAGDSSPKICTTAFANPGVSTVGGNVVIRLPSGHKIQLISCNPAGGTVHVTYPVAFTSYAFPVPGTVASGSVQTWMNNPTITGIDVSNTGGSSIVIAIGL